MACKKTNIELFCGIGKNIKTGEYKYFGLGRNIENNKIEEIYGNVEIEKIKQYSTIIKYNNKKYEINTSYIWKYGDLEICIKEIEV